MMPSSAVMATLKKMMMNRTTAENLNRPDARDSGRMLLASYRW